MRIALGVLLGVLIALSFKFDLLSADKEQLSFNYGILWNKDRGLNPDLLGKE